MQVPSDIDETKGGFRQLYLNQDEGRVRAPLRVVALLISLLLAGLAYGVIAGAIEEATDPGAFVGILLSQVGLAIVLLLTILYVVVFIDRRSVADIGLQTNGRWWQELAFGFSLGAGMAAVVVLVPFLADAATITETMVTRDGHLATGLSLAAGLVLGFVMLGLLALFEELLFRGYLLVNTAEGMRGPLGERRAVLFALGLTSVLFALGHAINPNATLGSTLVILLFGLLLGGAYVYTDRLAIPIGLHWSWNFTIAQVFGLPISGLTAGTTLAVVEFDLGTAVTGGDFGPEGGLVAGLALLVGVFAVWLWLRVHGATELRESIAVPAGR